MNNSTKVMIVIHGFLLFVYLGAAVVSNSYLWLFIMVVMTISLFLLNEYIPYTKISYKIYRFLPFLFIVLFVFGLQLSEERINNNPQSIEVYTSDVMGEERVKIEYGLYNNYTLTDIDRPSYQVDLEMTSSGYVLEEPLDINFDFMNWFYMLLGIPLLITCIVQFLNNSSNRVQRTSKDSVWKAILASGDRFGSKSPRTDHIQHQESFISETAKNKMIDENSNKH